ncbi:MULTISPECIES: RES family NAD+ phosphorylase [unclassified Sphingomonas]|uniref:RES family NAD+ phosphorylase n=1 Tax=unclassified Sphingomonas TaxID=196159 RepID=UPI00226B0D49|nr:MULTISPECIES: RES family NAD+ phosphorylase [unclassified Sphingomonas]
MTCPLGPLHAPLWRMLSIRYQHAPFSGEGARLYGGRWNAKGVAALYAALDPVTAVAEYYQGFPRPGTLAPYRIEAVAIADLTDGHGHPRDAAIAAALAAPWKAIAAIDGAAPSSWTLAATLIDAGADGALVPSAQNSGATALVLWRWHGAEAAGEGARLALLDPEGSLTSVR